MKNYIIYLKVEPDCPDKSTKEVIDKAREKALESAKKQFPKDIEELIKSKDITIKKEQLDPNGIMIGVNEDNAEKTMKTLIALDIVQVIDAEYSGPPPKYEHKEKEAKIEITSKEKMEKYLK